jgi:beta-N-acetylhexosaminidase
MHRTRLCLAALLLIVVQSSHAEIPLREKIGQMVMVTFTGDSLEEHSASMDTLKSDLSEGLIGGVTYFTWAKNLTNPKQITRLSQQLQQRAGVPLLIATDQEGGKVARLSAANGFANTQTAYQLGTVVNLESATRAQASLMAGWLLDSGINTDFAPDADVDVNPVSPAIGALDRSFSAKPDSVALHTGWFIDELHKKHVLATAKHFPGHGSASTDSHAGFTDITTSWSSKELIPFQTMIDQHSADIIMIGHLFNKTIDSVYPASLSYNAITQMLRKQMGFKGVVITDAMSMGAITNNFGFSESIVHAVNAGVDLLLYTTNLDSINHSLARSIVTLIEQKVNDHTISLSTIDSAYQRIMTLKQRFISTYAANTPLSVPTNHELISYPNPFNPATTLRFTLAERSHVELAIYDVLGREVDRLLDEEMHPGTFTLRWDAGRHASGVYYARLIASGTVVTQRLVYLR